jgi:ssDNA-binding Zn-finger/Zn-ribbon topoisomerase 1
MVEYKAIKIPSEDYENIEEARQQLAIKGIKTLPKQLREVEVCPICGSKMEGFSVKYQYLRCSNPKCNYKQRNLHLDATGAFAIGAIVGLGVAALIYLLTQNEK